MIKLINNIMNTTEQFKTLNALKKYLISNNLYNRMYFALNDLEIDNTDNLSYLDRNNFFNGKEQPLNTNYL